jgi:hypothetical protein
LLEDTIVWWGSEFGRTPYAPGERHRSRPQPRRIILHQLGLDHEQLTYRYAGRDFRLTDVHGRVVRELLV